MFNFVLDRLVAGIVGALSGALLGLAVIVWMAESWSMQSISSFIAWEGPIRIGAIVFAAIGLLFGAAVGTAIGRTLNLLWGNIVSTHGFEPGGDADWERRHGLPHWLRWLLLLIVAVVLIGLLLD